MPLIIIFLYNELFFVQKEVVCIYKITLENGLYIALNGALY